MFILGYLTSLVILIALADEFIIKPNTSYLFVWMLMVLSVILCSIVGYWTIKLPTLVIAIIIRVAF